MSPSAYRRIASLISRIRNAKFGQMVGYVEELIESDAWRDFTTPAGTHFEFRPMEFDYFLAAQEIDPTLVRYAYLKADGVADLVAKRLRLADLTGKGVPYSSEDRRQAEEVARAYDGDSSGAGARIRNWAVNGSAVVSDPTSRAAKQPDRREALESGRATSPRPRNYWRVEWVDDSKTTAEAIAEKLLGDPALAHEVYKRLHSWSVANAAKAKRRSEATVGANGRGHLSASGVREGAS